MIKEATKIIRRNESTEDIKKIRNLLINAFEEGQRNIKNTSPYILYEMEKERILNSKIL